jgi:N-methylhydantoinase B
MVTEIRGEALRPPPIRLYCDGKPDPSGEAIIFANVRKPAERLGDLRAQVAADYRAVRRLTELAAKYGPDTLLGIMQEMLDYSETMMRAALRTLPDGEALGTGGYGPTSGRDRTALSEDLLDGYVTLAEARRVYGAEPV